MLEQNGEHSAMRKAIKIPQEWEQQRWDVLLLLLLFFFFSNYIAPDKRGIHIIYFLFLHEKHLGEGHLMSTHNIRFCGEIRKISVLFG